MRLLLTIVFLLCAAQAEARTYYHVKASGGSTASVCADADTTSRTDDPGTYFRTIIAAMNAGCKGSDKTILVHDGVVTGTRLGPSDFVAGSVSAPFTIEALNPRAATYRPSNCVDGSGVKSACISIDDDNIQIIGLILDLDSQPDDHNNGLKVDSAINVVIDNMQFINHKPSGNSMVLFGATAGSGVRITRSHVAGTSSNYCLYNKGVGTLVDHNLFEDCHSYGIHNYDPNSVAARNNIYEYNIVRNYGNTSEDRAAILLGQGGGNNRVYRNIFYNGTNAYGVKITSSSNLILNNTIASTDRQAVTVQSGSSNTIQNNIFSSNGSPAVSCTPACTQTTNLTSASPGFISSGTGNYCLASTATTAIDQGTARSGFTFNGSAPDIGACETIPAPTASASGNIMSFSFPMNINTPLIPSTGVITFTVNNGRTVTGAIRKSGSNTIIDATFSGAACAESETWTGTYAVGNLTDSSLFGDGTSLSINQRVNAFGPITADDSGCTGGTPSAHTFTQSRFRFHQIHGTESSPVLIAAENIDVTLPKGAALRVRMKVKCDVADCPAQNFRVQYDCNECSVSGGAYTDVPDVFTADSIAWYGIAGDPSIPDEGTPTTEILTSDETTNVAGAIVRTSSGIPNVDLSQDSEVELEFIIKFNTDAVVGRLYEFRVRKDDGTALDTYSDTPGIRVGEYIAGMGF